MANNTNEYRFESSTRNAMTAAITSVVMGFASFVERMVFNQCFISDYLGFYSLFKNIISVLAVAELGMSAAISYALYAPLAEDNYEEVTVIMNFFKRVYKVMGTFILTGGLIVTPFMGYFVKTEVSLPYVQVCFIIFLLCTVFEYYFYYNSIIISASQQEYVNTLITNLCWAVMYIVQIAVSIITKSFFIYSMCILFFTLVRCVSTNILTRKKFPYLRKKTNKKLSPESKEKIISNVKGLVIVQLGGVLVNSTDSLLISSMVGSAILGLYSNYQMITKGLLGFTRILPNAITASLGNMGAVETSDRMVESYKAIDMSFYLIYGFLSIVTFNIISPVVQVFFGTERALPLSSGLIICLLFYISNLKSLYSTYKSSLGLYWYDRIRPLISGVTNIIVSLILGHFWGLDGILAGTIFTYVVIDLWVEPMIIFHHGFHESSHAYIIATMLRLLFVALMMLLTNHLTDMLPFTGITGIIAKTVVSLLLTSIVFIVFYHRNRYVKTAVKAVRKFIFKKEA